MPNRQGRAATLVMGSWHARPTAEAKVRGTADLDAQSGPAAALLRDPATGRVRGILRDWPDTAVAQADATAVPEPGLEVQVSRGVPAQDAWRR